MAQVSMVPRNQAMDVLKQVERATAPEPPPVPEPTPPESGSFTLCGGIPPLLPGEPWVRDFEVRELTGRDEEHLSKIQDPAKMMISIVQRGLVSVGGERCVSQRESDDILDRMFGGDWDTVMLAVYIATFGATYTTPVVCQKCGEKYEVDIDLRDGIDLRFRDTDDVYFKVSGRHGVEYSVGPVFGSAQRKALLAVSTSSISEMNSLILGECVLSINGKPVLGKNDVLNIPIADRRLVLQEIDKRQVGPDFREVKTKCPACDVEQPMPLNVVALFQG